MFSDVQHVGFVSQFPKHTGERHYMIGFNPDDGLPEYMKHWQPVVDAMLEGITHQGKAYVMVDQGMVKPTSPHRRGGVHIDGIWYPGSEAHGHRPTHLPPCPPRWDYPKPRHLTAGHDVGHGGGSVNQELLVLATDVMASVGYRGEWDGVCKAGGDCTHVNVSNMETIYLERHKVWAGDTMTMLHESIPTGLTQARTLVRLNVPNGKMH